MELGNLVFGNSRGEYEVDRDLQDSFHNLLELLGFDGYGFLKRTSDEWKPASVYGVTNGVFTVRNYYWGDCECNEEHVKDCPTTMPNFEHAPSGLKLQWYKYPLRDSYSNVPLTEEMISKMISEVKR